jgi:hypothetical protein
MQPITKTLALLSVCLATALCTTPLAAQAAQFSPFGTGCAFQGQTLQIGSTGLPQLGNSSFQITYSGPNYTMNSGQQIAWPQLVLGFSLVTTLIPQSLLPQQPAGCIGLISGDALLPTAVDPNGRPSYESFIDLPVPNNPVLMGLTFHAQWVLVFQQCGFAGCGFAAVPTSDAATLLIGT